VKKVMFGFILELLNGNGNLAFFDLHAGGHKANNA
jgi:prepilin-type processing-associated H-X9-DG protein